MYQSSSSKRVGAVRGYYSKLAHLGKKLWRWTSSNAFIVGLLSIIWFAIRTGTKPSRAAYPCQRIAAGNSYAWLATYIFPLFVLEKHVYKSSSTRRRGLALLFGLLLIGAVTWNLSNTRGGALAVASEFEKMSLSLAEKVAEQEPASDIFAVNGTTGHDGGVTELISLMGQHGLLFYQSEVPAENKGPTGLIAKDDVVIIKINCQWDKRGGTNTDLIRELIQAVVQHPDGFTGEIVVADNGQAQYGTSGRGGSFEYSQNNAEDISQSVQKVVDSFSGSYKVSTYLWDTITRKTVGEYSEGDLEDGYIVATSPNPRTGALVAYPKFCTTFGTLVSFKLGIWDTEEASYNSDRLKVINVPVLKNHRVYGVTACVKHYMGVTSDKLTAQLGAQAHYTVGEGGMGTEMAETRVPILNVLDAIWVNSTPGGGPYTGYDQATRVNIIAAGTDPVALDYWASKYVLCQLAQERGFQDLYMLDPDYTSPGFFGSWLRLSMEELVRAGYQATADDSAMNVYVSEL